VIRIGVLTPHTAKGAEAEFPAMAPGLVDVTVARIATDDPADVSDRRLDEAAERLAAGPIDGLAYASTSAAYAVGFDLEAALLSRLARLVRVPVAATCASAVLALRALGVARLALVHPPWFETSLNELGAAYFQNQGVDVVFSASADLPNDPSLIEPEAVCEWTSRHVRDDAEAVFIGGNGFRAAGAIEPLEIAIRRPVLTSNQVLLWNLLGQAGAELQISGYGRLFARRPRSADDVVGGPEVPRQPFSRR
jgi:maleate isomerase